jgi:DNA-binding beta-propeller fold protein YncE
VARVRAPELVGQGGWIGVDRLSLADLHGKVVLLHFWTFCCANCVNVVEELRGVERRFADELVIVGVHSPKFPHEHDHDAVRAAVARHRIEHPVLDDAATVTWDAYAVRAWPTLVLVDPEGYIVWQTSGEGQAVEVAREVERLVAEHDARGTLRRGRLDVAAEAAGTAELAFPGKVSAHDDGRLAISDTGHDRVLVCGAEGEVLHEVGGLYQPQGVRWDGDDALLVCETAADAVWRIDVTSGERRLLTDAAHTPWDVIRWRGHVVVAEAARHRLIGLDSEGEPQVIAGTAAEGLRDGPAFEAVLAQPSGLAVTPAGDLAFVDAEASALRVLRAATLHVDTLVGAGLFSWGRADGAPERARLQHPLGVAAAPDGALYVADAFNGLLRVRRGTHLWTVPVDGFSEPGGVDLLADGRLVVADTGAHRVVVIDPIAAEGEVLDVGRPASVDRLGMVPTVSETVVQQRGTTLPVRIDLDLEGDALDAGGGAPVRVTAEATVSGLLRGPAAWELDALPAEVELELGAGSGRITLELRAATCAADACRLRRTQRAWDVILGE